MLMLRLFHNVLCLQRYEKKQNTQAIMLKKNVVVFFFLAYFTNIQEIKSGYKKNFISDETFLLLPKL